MAPFAVLSRATTQIFAAVLAIRAVAFTRRSEVGRLRTLPKTVVTDSMMST